jgi:DNA-binding NarL/FixJ family response regulator
VLVAEPVFTHGSSLLCTLGPSTTPMVPIALIDDHALFREALAGMIAAIGGYEVVVQAGNGQEYQAALASCPPPAVALVDLHMPVMDGYATIAWIRQHQPGTRALALTLDNDTDTCARALHCGACGFLPKSVTRELFRTALDEVVRVGRYVNEALLVPTTDQATAPSDSERARLFALLSPREQEFIRHVCHPSEPTYEQIADRMGVSPNTVHGYREAVFHKLKVKSKAGLVSFGFKWGVV